MKFDIIDELKSTISIETVLRDLGGLDLKKKGDNYLGNCPTGHSSKGGNCFGINTSKNYYHCFNCGESGDIISLVELAENKTFKEAIEWLVNTYRPELLSEITGIKDNYSEKMDKKYYSNAILYEEVYNYGKRNLSKDKMDYLIKERNYKTENIEKTEWIYFPLDKEIRNHLKKKFPDAEDAIDSLSLQGAFGDRFRLAFPYRDNNTTN